MSTPFLLAYSLAVIQALLARDLLLLSGTPEQAAKDLADFLGTRKGFSLISSTSMGLLRSDAVTDLYAEDDEIKRIVDELGEN